MKWYNWRVIVGVLLVLLGAVALLQSLNVIPRNFEGQQWGGLFGAIFILIGIVFLPLVFQDRVKNWWAVIPGFTLIGLGLVVLASVLFPGDQTWLGSLFLGSIGLSFLAIFLLDRLKWWAIIPAGVLLSLTALVAGVDQGEWPAVILFAGIAVTFAVVALTAGPEKSRAWAWYPAGALALLAVIVSATTGPLPGLIWPALLILAGLALVGWTLLRPKV